MKNIFLLLVSMLPAAALLAQADAIECNDMIIGEQTKIGSAMNDFVISETPPDVDLNYKILIQQIESSIAEVKKMGGWQGDNEFMEATLRLFGFYQSTALNEYKQFAIILKKSDEEITDEEMIRLETIEEATAEKERAFDQDFISQQKAFAKLQGFTLE